MSTNELNDWRYPSTQQVVETQASHTQLHKLDQILPRM